MTRLSERKSRLAFTTDAVKHYKGRVREIVVEVDNGYCGTVRLAGTRIRYPFSFEGLYVAAAERFARQERERRKLERKNRRAK